MIHSILTLNEGLTPALLIIYLLLAVVVGMTKAGLSGLGLAVIPAMALIFGARESTGILLPMLLAGDIMAVIYYHRNAVWKHIIRIIPWVIIGITAALITGNYINENQFRTILMSVVGIMLVLMVVNDLRKKKNDRIPDSHIFSAFMGSAGGFATMIGNSAGPVFSLYFLSLRLNKNEFIGTGAWLYLLMNAGKMPLHIMVWKTISVNTLLLNLVSVPFIVIGMFVGIWAVKLFPEVVYRYFIIIATLATSIFLFI
jgi:uncharacterized membrane protein YfcA